MLDEITIPVCLFLVFVEDNVCPMCLGNLRGSEVCPCCHADLRPVLDALEGE